MIDNNYVYILTKKEYGICYYAKDNGILTSSIEDAKVFYDRKSARQYLRAITTLFERLWYWRIHKVNGEYLENDYKPNVRWT